MRIFVTGASGWIGRAVTRELTARGHSVRGLVRSPDGASGVRAAGGEPAEGDLDDLDALRREAARADAVVHLANKHDWAHPVETNRAERSAVQTLAEALAGSGRALLFAAGVAGLTPGRAVREDDPHPASGPDAPRGGAENLALSFADRGVRPVALRFAPSVHAPGDSGFVRHLADTARRTGVAGYVGSGEHSWAAVHRADAARLVAAVLDDPDAAHGVVHAVAESGIPTRRIAEALAAREGLSAVSIAPEDAEDHFGFLGRFFGSDLTATSDLTRARYAWEPREAGLIDDIARGAYDARGGPAAVRPRTLGG
jgi:nucleoside-diphosphate-sugar epimerase